MSKSLPFTDDVHPLLQLASAEAARFHISSPSAIHLLLAIAKTSPGITPLIFRDAKITPKNLAASIEEECRENTWRSHAEPVSRICEQATLAAIRRGSEFVSSDHIFRVLLSSSESTIESALRRVGTSSQEVLKAVDDFWRNMRFVELPDTEISFTIRSDDLEPEDISQRLGLTPTDSISAKETYQHTSRYFESPSMYGVWRLGSGSTNNHRDLERHADFILEQLEPKREQIDALLQDTSYKISIWISCQDPPYGWLAMTSDRLWRLATLCQRMNFRNHHGKTDAVPPIL